MSSSSRSSSPGSGEDEEAVYCICKSKDVSRFMIGCDHCEDWFHGDCVHVTERESKYIKKYYCKECRKKNSSLKVVYKSSYKEYLEKRERDKRIESYKEKSREQRHGHGHQKDKKKDKKRDRDEKDKKRDRDEKEKKRDKDEKEKKRETDEKEKKKRDKDKDRDRERRKEKERKEERRKQKEAEKEKQKQKIEVKVDVKAEDIVEHEEKKPEVRVESEFKPEPKPTQPTPSAPPSKVAERTSSTDSRPQKKKKKPPQPPKKAILKEKNKNYLSDSESDDDEEVEDDARLAQRVAGGDEESDSEDAWEPPQVVVSKPAAAAKPQSKKRTKPMPAAPKTSKKRRTRRESSSDEEQESAVSAPMHCYGPQCTKSSRPGSKYCSDQCGINLASMRIYQTLPDRIREWNLTPCEAEKKGRKELEKIRAKQMEVQTRLNQLMVDFRNLEKVIEKGKEQSINENDEEDEDEEAIFVQCVTCGSDVAARTAVRHMERCYNKIESQTSFASRYKTQIDDVRMFCDFYNRKEQTYCKRLKVLCPEHHPDPKADDREVCGYPLSKELLGKPSQFCLRAKKNCQAHFCWEKLRRAEIDMERVKQWMRVDELIEQERQFKLTMSNRSGVLGLMLHSTFNHELDGRWQAQRKAMQQNAQRKHGPPFKPSK